MPVYVDVQMTTETALKLVDFLQQHRDSQPELTELFGEIERQALDSIEYEAHYKEGTFDRKPLN